MRVRKRVDEWGARGEEQRSRPGYFQFSAGIRTGNIRA